ncbi:hypothetical protein NUW46_11180 [Marinobacter sp. MA]|jgi:hypothetical protein|uniref:hypothetical protein n=1 Tax=Marinobacter sp. MA TaxID=2971606 RepID=UPI003AAF9332
MNSHPIVSRASVLLFMAATYSSAVTSEVLFVENFDNQPDWTSGLEINATSASPAGKPDRVQSAGTHVIPQGWYSVRQDPVWAPSTGHPDRHETIEILASNSEKARGGVGKSFVSWRDSYDAGWNYWGSESMLVKFLPEGYDSLYVEFWIRFGDNWSREYVSGTPSPASKLFRVSSWSEEGSEYQAFGDGELGPIALWDHNVNSYGVRNALAFRGGPHGDNYGFSSGDISGLPRQIVGIGDINLNFTRDVLGMGAGGENPKIVDRVNGGYISNDPNEKVVHDQVFGPGGAWTKIAFYVKMNTAPGRTDGVFKQWLNGEQIFSNTSIPWIRPSSSENENAKWNLVAIGGNDFFQTYPNSDRREEWYSIDDVVIRTDIPADLMSEELASPPSPPTSLEVN